MKEQEVYEFLKNISLVDIINLVVKKNITNIHQDTQKEEVYYRTKDLIDLYPNIFSKFKIDKYIKNKEIFVIKDGKERIFLKSNIDEFLQRKKESQFNRVE